MIIVLKPRTTKDDVSRVENMVKKRGLDTHIVQGEGDDSYRLYR